jgi:hypothetical protein
MNDGKGSPNLVAAEIQLRLLQIEDRKVKQEKELEAAQEKRKEKTKIHRQEGVMKARKAKKGARAAENSMSAPNRERERAKKITSEMVDALKRPYQERISEDEIRSVDARLVHTFKSACEELRMKGFIKIQVSWLRIHPDGYLELGPLQEGVTSSVAEQTIPEGAWEIPTVYDGTKRAPFLIPPPVESWPVNFDDREFERMEKSMGDDQRLSPCRFTSPMARLCELIGLHLSLEETDMDAVERREKAWHFETAETSYLTEMLHELGLLDGDPHYDESLLAGAFDRDLGHAWNAAYVSDTLADVPENLASDDFRRLWTTAKAEDFYEMRDVFQELALASFLAGREYERNKIRPGIQETIQSRQQVPSKGERVYPHTAMFDRMLKSFLKTHEIAEAKPGAFKKFIKKNGTQEDQELLAGICSRKPHALKGFLRRERAGSSSS